MLGCEIKKIRNFKGISQANLAKRIKTTQAQISKYESGAQRPTPEHIVGIAKVLEYDYLLTMYKYTSVTHRYLLEKHFSESPLADHPNLLDIMNECALLVRNIQWQSEIVDICSVALTGDAKEQLQLEFKELKTMTLKFRAMAILIDETVDDLKYIFE